MHAPAGSKKEGAVLFPKERYACHVGANGSLVDHTYRNRVRITGFGRLYYGTEVDWSGRPYQKVGDGAKDLPSAKLLPQVADSLGIREVLMPKPVFGTEVCQRSHLRTTIRFTHENKAVTLFRGYDADVCVVHRGETFGITTAGCAVGWMYHPSKPWILVAHMGLKCLLDMQAVFLGQKTQGRKYRSVVTAMMDKLDLRSGQLQEVQAGYEFPINPLHYSHEWDHPTDGRNNEILCEYIAQHFGKRCILGWDTPEKRVLGRIELGFMIREQYLGQGIQNQNIHSTSAPDVTDTLGQPVWYDTRGPHGKDARNLVLVTAL